MLDQFFSSLSFVDIFNFCVFLVFSVCYVYQIFYVFVTLTKKPPQLTAKKNHRYAVIVAARNENAVIGDLIHSIRVQNYPQELIDIFVVADNCTDNTAAVAQEAGAIVFPRFNKEHIGKGYALDYGFSCIRQHYSENEYEAYFVFDADNVLDVNYFREMNKTFDNGAVASTSYRNSKNYGSNWITAGYAVWFMREAKYLSQARWEPAALFRARVSLSARRSSMRWAAGSTICSLRISNFPLPLSSAVVEFPIRLPLCSTTNSR